MTTEKTRKRREAITLIILGFLVGPIVALIGAVPWATLICALMGVGLMIRGFAILPSTKEPKEKTDDKP